MTELSYDNHRVAELVGEIALVASVVQRRLPGEQSTLSPGDVVVFRGDQRHSYRNPGKRPAVGYSVVLLAPGGVRDGEDLAAIRLPYSV